MALFILKHKTGGVYYHSDGENGQVNTSTDPATAALLTAAGLVKFGEKGGPGTSANWEVLEAIGSASEPSARALGEGEDTGIIGPGGNNNPNPAGLPEKP